MKTDEFVKILRLFFILCGGKLYFDWILPTNPTSKNPLWKLLWALAVVSDNKIINPSVRLIAAFIYAAIHFVFFWIYLLSHSHWWLNVLINVYPVIVQAYIGLRCWRILKKRSKTGNLKSYWSTTR